MTNQANQIAVSGLKELNGFMEKLKPQLALALPNHMNADRMARLALTAFSTNKNMQECTAQSIASSIMIAGQLGLEPGVNGAGYLIPYKNTCTFVPGWKGLVDLVSRSGRGTVYTGVIFKDQRYTFTDGARRDLVIHNETSLEAPEDITHAFAIGWVKDAAMPIIELWTVEKIRKHRDKYNKVGARHYSYKDWEMYARKVPLLQVLKYMPASIELSNAMQVSYASEAGRGVTIEDGIVIDMGDQPDDQPDDQPAPRADSRIECSEESFKKQSDGWKKVLASRKKTVNELISFIEGREILSNDQKIEIASWATAGETA